VLVSLKDVYMLMSTLVYSEYLLVDIRSNLSFEDKHIECAQNLSADTNFNEFIANSNPPEIKVTPLYELLTSAMLTAVTEYSPSLRGN
jgi:hypothetical protein